jgi:hypothetical protein
MQSGWPLSDNHGRRIAFWRVVSCKELKSGLSVRATCRNEPGIPQLASVADTENCLKISRIAGAEP